jgi:hypothetical protein
MNECAKDCVRENKSCERTDCRMWINFKDDLNCTLVCVNKHGKMTLNEVAKRMDLSIVRIKQVQDKAIQKLKKKSSLTY